MTLGLRYLGRGEFIPGVPARDLTEEEVRLFREILEEHHRNTGRQLYGPPVPAPGPVVELGEDTTIVAAPEAGDTGRKKVKHD